MFFLLFIFFWGGGGGGGGEGGKGGQGGCEWRSEVFVKIQRGGSTLYEIYIGFCPRIDFHNIMHIDFLTYDYSICDIVYLLPIYMSKTRDVM